MICRAADPNTAVTSVLIKLFIKNSDNVKDVRVRSAYGTMVSVVCIVLNLLVAAGKIAVGALFGARCDEPSKARFVARTMEELEQQLFA